VRTLWHVRLAKGRWWSVKEAVPHPQTTHYELVTPLGGFSDVSTENRFHSPAHARALMRLRYGSSSWALVCRLQSGVRARFVHMLLCILQLALLSSSRANPLISYVPPRVSPCCPFQASQGQ
jgi:hypothetical protein